MSLHTTLESCWNRTRHDEIMACRALYSLPWIKLADEFQMDGSVAATAGAQQLMAL